MVIILSQLPYYVYVLYYCRIVSMCMGIVIFFVRHKRKRVNVMWCLSWGWGDYSDLCYSESVRRPLMNCG